MTYFRRWPAWRCRTSSRPRSASAVAVARDPRHRRAAAVATLGNFWAGPRPARCSTSCCRSRSSARWCWSRRASIQTLGGYRRLHARPGGEQTLALGPVASQEAIKELGTNGGGFFNVNSAHPVREPDRLLELRRDAAHPADPGGAHRDLRAHGRQPPPGLGDLRRDGGPVRRRRRRRLRRRAARHRPPSTPPGRPRPQSTAPPAATWRARSSASGSPTRRLDGDHDRRLERRGQRGATSRYTGIGGAVPIANMMTGEVDLRRRRHRAVRDAAVRPAGGLHRRADGRPHARVPRQEDRGARDQARR